MLELLLCCRVCFLQDGQQTLHHPVSGWCVVTQVTQNAVETSGVQFGVVNEEKDQETGQTLVIKQVSASELVIIG